MVKNAIILLSGGIDSSTALAFAINSGFTPYVLTFDYGQQHLIEIERAFLISKHFNVINHQVIKLNIDNLLDSSLISSKTNEGLNFSTTDKALSTYVPARNIIFLSYALAWAEKVNSTDIFIGINMMDQIDYPDCSESFISAFQKMANIGLSSSDTRNIYIHTPFIKMKKSEVIKEGIKLGVKYNDTISCYCPTTSGLSCGKCLACTLRLNAFSELEIRDPLDYISSS